MPDVAVEKFALESKVLLSQLQRKRSCQLASASLTPTATIAEGLAAADLGRAETRYLFSAKGAAFIISLGQRRRDPCNAKPPGLKARFIPVPICVGLTANRCVESRFQRWSIIRSESWGDAPGWYESALLALNTSEARSCDFSLKIAPESAHHAARLYFQKIGSLRPNLKSLGKNLGYIL